jgi:hypothetical protein
MTIREAEQKLKDMFLAFHIHLESDVFGKALWSAVMDVEEAVKAECAEDAD